MAVRFLPPPEERSRPQREDRGDLAEVIEFRAQVRRPEPQQAWLKASDEPTEQPEPAISGHRTAWRPVVAERIPVVEEQDASDAASVAPREQTVVPARAKESQREAARPATKGLRLVGTAEAKALLAAGENVHESAERRVAFTPSAAAENGVEAHEEEGPTARQHAVKLLARKALTSGELQRGLVAAGYSALDAEIAVAECVEALYLNDFDVAEAVAQKLRDSKGESKARIRQKLRERLLPDEAIEAALGDLDDDEEFELLRQTAADRARRLVDLDRQTAERRLLGFLARRGWSGERASRAAREALDAVMRSGGGSVRFR